MTREEAIKELNRVFEPAYANYIVIALTDGATVSDTDVLDQIRAEIEMMNLGESSNVCIKAHNNAIEDVLKIIDKYRGDKE